MNFSPRLTRAGLAFLVFGMVASVLPTTTNVLADAGGCPNANSRGRGRGSAFKYFRVHPGKGSNPKSDPGRQFTNDPDEQFSNLKSFVRSRSRSR